MRILVSLSLFAVLPCIQNCGHPDEINEESNVPAASDIIETLNLSPTPGEITVSVATFFKVSTKSSSELNTTQKCSLPAGTVVSFKSSSDADNHVFVELDKNPTGCNFNSGYFFKGHIVLKYIPVYSVTSLQATKFKALNKQSSALNASQLCDVSADTKIYLEKAPEDAVDSHIKVTLKAGQLSSCSFQTGYFYRPHLKEVEGGQDYDFTRVMKPILLWEGGCSDHPNDPGGRTYQGITTSRARQNGWYADVCTMPHTMVLDIYKKDYYNQRAVNYAWPLNLAVMNTEVNSGGGRAQIFLDRMRDKNIQGTLVQKASWFVDQQTAFYYSISNYNPDLKVFLAGWLNRSNYMQDVIHGRITLGLMEQLSQGPRAKAFAP